MPVFKFRSVEEMEQGMWHPIGSPALFRAIRGVWELAERTCRRRFPPGVYRLRSMEEAERLREAWEQANFEAYWQRQRERSSSAPPAP